MTAALLLKSLCAYIRQEVDQYAAAQGSASQDFRKPEVFEWWLPFKDRKRGEEEDKIDFPYITARIETGKDQLSEAEVKIELIFGVYSEGTLKDGKKHPDGAYDLLNLMEHVRIALFRQKIIDGKFQLKYPYDWDIPEEQPYPLWVGRAKTLWNVQSVTSQIEEAFLHGGTYGR